MLHVIVKQGDILNEAVDVLVCSANPQLNMSGGLGGEILIRGGAEIQQELHRHLADLSRKFVEAGTVVTTSSGPLKQVGHIVHAVAIDAWYQSGPNRVAAVVEKALQEAARLQAHTVALPGLAMGYGRLPVAQFAAGLKLAVTRDYPPIEELRVVMRKAEDAAVVRSVLAGK